VVDAATAHEWETAKRSFARLLGRGDDKQTWLAEQRLTETRKKLIGAAGTDMALTRRSLEVGWTARLLDFLEENPGTEADLQTLVHEIGGEPPAEALAAAFANGAVTGDRGGPGDLRALAARSELAYSKGLAGDAAGARDEFAALLPTAERILGAEHPDTLAARSSLAYWTGQAGDTVGARDQFAALLSVAERVLGPEHPDTLTNRHNVANFAGYAGDAGAARDQFAALVPVSARVFGPEHPDTLAARSSLAYWTGQAGDAAAARDQFAALLPVRERVCGPEDTQTMAVWYQLAHWTALARESAPD
jgi:Tetratricopeptide repeat